MLDVQHGGLNAISFAIACLTLAGVLGWAMYTAYGLAAMPFDWLRGKQSASEQRLDVESSIASLRVPRMVLLGGYPRVFAGYSRNKVKGASGEATVNHAPHAAQLADRIVFLFVSLSLGGHCVADGSYPVGQ